MSKVEAVGLIGCGSAFSRYTLHLMKACFRDNIGFDAAACNITAAAWFTLEPAEAIAIIAGLVGRFKVEA